MYIRINVHQDPSLLNRAGGRTPRTLRPGGGLTYVRGLMLRMKFFFQFFNLFKIFVKMFVHNEIYCIVVTYLIFEFFIPAACIVQTLKLCMKMYCYFLLNIKYGASQLYLGANSLQLWGPGEGPLWGRAGRVERASEAPGEGPLRGPGGGAPNSLAPTLLLNF